MRIAFFVNPFPALSQTFILNQITSLLDQGHDVEVFAVRPEHGNAQHPEIATYALLERTTYRVPRSTNPVARVWAATKQFDVVLRTPWRTIRSLNVFRYGRPAATLELLHGSLAVHNRGPFDIVHAHFGPTGIIVQDLFELGALEGKLAVTFYGHDVTRYPLQHGIGVYARLFRGSQLVLALSEHMRQQLIALGCPEVKAAVHHLGVNCERFTFRDAPAVTGPVQVLTIARLVEKKGVEYGLDAIAQLVNSGRSVRYRIVGGGPLLSNLQAHVARLRIGKHVEFLGWRNQDEVAMILDKSDILLAPSITARDGDEEGTPTVLFEAMARGLPVVSTVHSGIPEVVDNGRSGLLVPEKDSAALAESIGRLIDDAELRKDMGRNGRRRVEEEFDIRKLAKHLEEMYARIVERTQLR